MCVFVCVYIKTQLMFHSKLFSKLLLLNKLAADHPLASLNELILKPFFDNI